jgi:hypothetical protein
MSQKEWEEWEAGSNERGRRLYERAKRGEDELKAKLNADSESSSGAAGSVASSPSRTRSHRPGQPPPWMSQEEWDEWQAGADDRDRRLWERIKKHQAEQKAREQAEADAAARPRRRRRFGFLPL